MFAGLWAITGEVESFSTNGLFGLYLAEMGRSVDVRNNYPMVYTYPPLPAQPHLLMVRRVYQQLASSPHSSQCVTPPPPLPLSGLLTPPPRQHT